MPAALPLVFCSASRRSASTLAPARRAFIRSSAPRCSGGASSQRRSIRAQWRRRGRMWRATSGLSESRCGQWLAARRPTAPQPRCQQVHMR
eukprot:1327443-Prymnesium_polylepis.1